MLHPAVIPVKLPQAHYDIVISAGSLVHLGREMATRGHRGKVLVVSHPQILRHHGQGLQDSLNNAGFEVHLCLLPAGERYKTQRSLSKIYDAALEAGLERSSTIVAFGGGVIGDMAGYAASSWLRGIPFVQVPTSLLAMVDASIGGKTGVNHPRGKNLIGAFHQPRLVWIDPLMLKTLPQREFRSAMAEVIKYGVIQAPDLFEFLEGLPSLHRYGEFRAQDLNHILVRAAECKALVVQQDEQEQGLRAILNYGHTLGHALESLTQYRGYLHGEAVAVGMVAAGEIAHQMGQWTRGEADRQLHLIQRSKLPYQWPVDLSLDSVLRSLKSDKKVKDGRVRFILPQQLGQVEITDQVTDQVIQQSLQAITAEDR